MKKYASQYVGTIRRQISEMLADGKDREEIVDILHQSYHDRTYLAGLVHDIVNPEAMARITGTKRTLALLMGAYGCLATLLGVFVISLGGFSATIITGPFFLLMAWLVRVTKQASAFDFIAMTNGIMFYFYLRFAMREQLTPLGLIELAWFGLMAWLASRVNRKTTTDPREIVFDRSFDISGRWTDETERTTRAYWVNRGFRMRKTILRGLKGYRGGMLSSLPSSDIRRVRMRLRLRVKSDATVFVRLTTQRGLRRVTEADRAMFRLELLEFQSVLQGAGTFAGVWEEVAKLQRDTRKQFFSGPGRIPEYWTELLEDLESADSFGLTQHTRMHSVLKQPPHTTTGS